VRNRGHLMMSWFVRHKATCVTVLTLIAASPFIPGWAKEVVTVISVALSDQSETDR
jgi:hypothetical protein